jgi:hypothetical protein
MKNKIVEQILLNRKQYKSLLENHQEVVNNCILILEKVSPKGESISNFKKPENFEEFVEQIKKYSGLEEIPEQSLKQLKTQWENAKKQEALGIGSPGMAPNISVGRDFEQQMSGLPKYSIPALTGKDMPSTITPDYEMDERQSQQKFLQKEYPTLANVDKFTNQAVDRIKELGTDPAFLAMAVGSVLLTMAVPALGIPLGLAALGLGGYSAYQQASQDDYGGAAVDLTLGLAGGRAGLRALGKPATARGAYSAAARSAAKETPKATDTGMPESLKTQEPPTVKFQDPLAYDWLDVTGTRRASYPYQPSIETPIEFGPMSGWDLAFRGQGRPGTFGTRVRTSEGGSARLSRMPTKKQRAKIERFGTAEEKAALARADQKRLGKQIGGEVGERISQSDIPVVKQAIANYNKLAREMGVDTAVPPTPQQIAFFERQAGFVPQPQITRDIFGTRQKGTGTFEPEAYILPRNPSDYDSASEYINAVAESRGRELNQTEKNYLERAYAEDVRAKKMFEREPTPTLSQPGEGGIIKDLGPKTKTVAAIGAVPGAVAGPLSSTKIPELAPTTSYTAKAPAQAKYSYSFEPFIPSKTQNIPAPSTVSSGLQPTPLTIPTSGSKVVIPVSPAATTEEDDFVFTQSIIKDLIPQNNPILAQVSSAVGTPQIPAVGAPQIPAVTPLPQAKAPPTKTSVGGIKLPAIPVIPKDYNMGVSGKKQAIDVGTIMQRILGKYAGTQRIR